MRTAFRMAVGLTAVLGVPPAAFAQEGKSARAGAQAEERQGHQRLGRNSSISLAVPTGRVSVDLGSAGGEPVFVRRTTVGPGMTILEVSTTPFEPVLASKGEMVHAVVRPDQPAGW